MKITVIGNPVSGGGKTKIQVEKLAQVLRHQGHLVEIFFTQAARDWVVDRLREVLLSMHKNVEGRRILKKTGGTTKFDILPGGEEGVRRRLLESFFSPEKREK